MWLVIGVNQDEFGRGNSKPVSKFRTREEAMLYVMRYNGNASLLEVYEATQVRVSLTTEPLASGADCD